MHPEAAVENSLPPTEEPDRTVNSVVDLKCKKAFGGAIVKATCTKYNSTHGRWESTDKCNGILLLELEFRF